jgi:hypothetical protein
MTILLIIFTVLAIASVPLTRFAVGSDYDLDTAPWYLKAILYPLSFALWGYLLFRYGLLRSGLSCSKASRRHLI